MIVVEVGAVEALGYDSLQIMLAAKLEEPLAAAALDMVHISNSGRRLVQHHAQAILTRDQRPIPQVDAIHPQQIKAVEHRITAAEEQCLEISLAVAVEADNFAIQDRARYLEPAQRAGEFLPSFKPVSVARPQLAAAVIDDGECTEAVPLEFVDPGGIVEGRRAGRASWG